jgi:hypothetical protein
VSVTESSTSAPVRERQSTVRVLVNARGEWEVLVPHCMRPLRFKSLDDATRMAYAVASRNGPCELVVHDDSHRVVHAEHIGAG